MLIHCMMNWIFNDTVLVLCALIEIIMVWQKYINSLLSCFIYVRRGSRSSKDVNDVSFSKSTDSNNKVAFLASSWEYSSLYVDMTIRNWSCQCPCSLEPSSPGKTVPVQKPSCSEKMLASADTIFLSVRLTRSLCFLDAFHWTLSIVSEKRNFATPFGNVQS